MRPLAQVFQITEPVPGTEAVFITGIDLYFRAVPSNGLGIEVQIRETVGGVPQSRYLPYASATLQPNEIQSSTDGSVATTFRFQSPVVVRSNESFAIAVIPLGGVPGYRLWTAQKDLNDVITGTKIVFPNNVGSLYAPSNDLSYTVLQNQCLKFNLRRANFISTTGNARFITDNPEFFITRPPVGRFIEGERIVVSNNDLKLAELTVATATPYSNGEIVVQPNTATNTSTATAYGTVYFSNTTVTRLKDTVGKFSTTGGGLNGLTSSFKTVNPTVARTNTVITSACTIITVPTTVTPDNDFTVGRYIYVGGAGYNQVQVARITSVDSVTRQITLDKPMRLTDSDASYGRVKSDGNLYTFISFSQDIDRFFYNATRASSANTSENFSNVGGQRLIGINSGATAVVDNTVNIVYDSVTTQISSITSKSGNVNFQFTGYGNNAVSDGAPTPVFSEVPYEIPQRQRMIYSRSNEITQLGGARSFVVDAQITTANSKFSPYLDYLRSVVHFTSNDLVPESVLSGFHLNINNANGTFTRGDVVWQSNTTSNTTGVVIYANSSFVSLSNVVTTNTAQYAQFTTNSTSIITKTIGGTVANVSAVSLFNESIGNGIGTGFKTPSRYISKTVVLAEGQDAEDLVVFLTAYRPSGTNIKVYCKLLNAGDSDPFDEKSWTPMTDTNPTLFSSFVNREDYLELKFELPKSVRVHSSNISLNTTSAIVNFTNSRTTEQIVPGMFVYMADETLGTFTVRRVLEVPNSSAIVVSSNNTFNSSNAEIGYIDGTLRRCNAFRYTNNNDIARYVCQSTESIFDGFKTFAIKIVLVSDETMLTPKVADMRALALQI